MINVKLLLMLEGEKPVMLKSRVIDSLDFKEGVIIGADMKQTFINNNIHIDAHMIEVRVTLSVQFTYPDGLI